MSPPRLAGLIGLAEDRLSGRLGEPDGSRLLGSESWWTWSGPGWELRVRCGPAKERAVAGRAVASWSLLWREGHPTLRAAVEPLGFWPEAGPDVAAAELDRPLARRGVRAPGEGPERSLTAGVRNGRFVRVACFDEPPDWR